MVDVSEQDQIAGLQEGNKVVFEWVYKLYFKSLYGYAFALLQTDFEAEEIVQKLFVAIWEKKETLQIQTSLKSYLYRSIHNACMNRIKHEKVKQQYTSHTTHVMKTVKPKNPSQVTQYKELKTSLIKALEELPEQCRTVFQLSRFDGLKYKEIANQLGISEKTVENHMGKALKLMRVKLAEFLISIAVIIIHIKNSIS